MIMKHLMVTSAILLSWIAGEVMADCTNPTRVTGNALRTLIEGNTVCASVGADQWQEQHRAGGGLWDYKKGPDDPVDPTAQVGEWSISRNEVIYSYYLSGTEDIGPEYTYSVHDTGGGSYDFCAGGSEVVTGAAFRAGEVSCN
jgi:hypothetical protein